MTSGSWWCLLGQEGRRLESARWLSGRCMSCTWRMKRLLQTCMLSKHLRLNHKLHLCRAYHWFLMALVGSAVLRLCEGVSLRSPRGCERKQESKSPDSHLQSDWSELT